MSNLLSFMTKGGTGITPVPKRIDNNDPPPFGYLNTFDGEDIFNIETEEEKKQKILKEKIEKFKKTNLLVEKRMKWIDEKQKIGYFEELKEEDFNKIIHAYEQSVSEASSLFNDIINLLGKDVSIQEVIEGKWVN